MAKGNVLIGQSGGPTSVINSSLAGVVDASMKSKRVGRVLGMRFGIEGVLNDHLVDLGSESADVLREVLCCLPMVEVPAQIGYDRVFRVTIIQFLDRFNFCLAGVKRSCIHFVTPDRRIIPFDTYNMLHRRGWAA